MKCVVGGKSKADIKENCAGIIMEKYKMYARYLRVFNTMQKFIIILLAMICAENNTKMLFHSCIYNIIVV